MHNQICSSLAGKASTVRIEESDIRRTAKTLIGGLENAAVQFFDAVLTWRESVRSRHDLARLDDRMLSDIGISRATVEQETARPFWR